MTPGDTAVAEDGTAGQMASVGPSPLRRLGREELNNTLHDLFPALPADFEVVNELPDDNEIRMAFALPGTVSDLEVTRLMDIAEAVLAALGGATPAAQFDCAGQDETSCARSFVETFGARVFRRPPASVEIDDLMALYQVLRSDAEAPSGFLEALDAVTEAMLQAPGFVYRWERGLAAPLLDGNWVKFDSWEMASRLSYFLYNSMPDEALFTAAAADALRTPAQVAEQARRMLAEPRVDATLVDFVQQWLELGPLPTLVKDDGTYPEFSDALRDAMGQETRAFALDVLRGPEPTLGSLLTAPYTFASPELASYYGVGTDAQGRVDLSNTARQGLLTQAGVMAVKGNSYRTSPVRRGEFVLNRMLCRAVPPPPPNVVPDLPPPDPNLTLREQMAAHRADPTCASCHQVMDALGFAFEHFDGAGKYRDTDQGLPVDASGSVVLDGNEIAFQNAAELTQALAGANEVSTCFAKQWLRYAIDRFEQPADAAAVEHLARYLSDTGSNAPELMVEITRTLPFSHRAPAEGEVLIP